MISWASRVRAQITLDAPDGARFTAYWQGNDIEAGKRVGQFDYPLVDGTETQDLGAKGLTFPLTLSFEGDDHDTQALTFLRALSQRGTWTVSHPVYGGLSLQPVSATLTADPTGSANVSKVETQWIESAETDISISTAELGAQIAAQVDEVSAVALQQFEEGCDLADPEAVAAIASAGTQGLSSVKASRLHSLVRSAADVQAGFDNLYAQAQAAFTAVPMDLIEGAGQVQALLQLPAMIAGDITGKIAAFSDFAQRVVDNLVEGFYLGARNQAVVSELFLCGTLAGAALSVSTASPETREQAVQSIVDLDSLFANATAALDGAQTAASGNVAQDQYFSNGISFAALARLVGLAIAYLLRRIFDLKVARRFTLDRPRAPIEITISEYGELGPGDSYLDLFIASNSLRADEIILLPAGREVVVYA